MSDNFSEDNKKIKKLLKIYSNDNQHIHKIGQILASPLSREIYIILIEKELAAKAIAQIVCDDDNLRLPNIVSILKKMVDSGLVTKQTKRQDKSGHQLSFYRSIPIILIVPERYVDKISKSKTLQNALRRIFSTFHII